MIRISKNWGFINENDKDILCLYHIPCLAKSGHLNMVDKKTCSVCGKRASINTIKKYNFISQDPRPYET